MALELRPNCECCDRDLPPDSQDVFICTFECTFCRSCATHPLGFVCPNCGGELTRRPIRPATRLARHPASTVRVRREDPCRVPPTIESTAILGILFRPAVPADVPALEELIPLSARRLQAACYSPEQIEGALGPIFGVDRQLIADGTYFVALEADRIVGCGGWSKRSASYGGDRGKTLLDRIRDPKCDPAMLRAFFVHPDFVRRGIGRRILELSEAAARSAGFQRLEMVATLAGVPLYESLDYVVVERQELPLPNGAMLPVARMRKRPLGPGQQSI